MSRRPLPAIIMALLLAITWATDCLGQGFVVPERPSQFIDTSVIPTASRTINVPNGGNLQDALNNAQPGDEIRLEGGATFRGPFTLRNKVGSGWIIIRPDAQTEAGMTAPGTRRTETQLAVEAPFMPKVVAAPQDFGYAFEAAPGAHNYWFISIEVYSAPGFYTGDLFRFGSDATTLDQLPRDIVLDRMYIHAYNNDPAKRGVSLNGIRLAVINSHLIGFKHQFQDTQAIMSWNGPGPYKIVNNYLEAAGENVMFGGDDPIINDAATGNPVEIVPSDIEIRFNEFFKPLAWRDAGWWVKNLFELKNARRVLVESNRFENCWRGADQDAFALQWTVRNQYGRCYWCTIEDVTFRKNSVRAAGGAINIQATDDPSPSRTMSRVLVQHNIFDAIDGAAYGGSGHFLKVNDWTLRNDGTEAGVSDLTVDHNTVDHTTRTNQIGSVINTSAGTHRSFTFTNNIVQRGDSGVHADDTAEGREALNRHFPVPNPNDPPNANFRRNVIAGANPAIYPVDSFFPASFNDVGFRSYTDDGVANDYYLLADTSPYWRQGTDGLDIGWNEDAPYTPVP